MPLKRTPPASPAISQASDTEHSVKNTTPAFDNVQNTTRPKKRKNSNNNCNDEMSTFMYEIKNMFKDFKEQQELSFSSLVNNFRELSEQIMSMRDTIDFMSKQYEAVTERIGKLEQERKNHLEALQLLEEKIEFTERYQRASSIEIRNIPKPVNKDETKDDLSDLVMRITKVINLPLKATDIRDIFRSNTKSANKPIIADFTTVLYKEKFLQAVKTYNMTYRTNKLNTSNIRIDGPSKPVFISENLTPKMRKLFHMAREFAKSNNYKYCWCAHGKIYLRKSDGAAHSRIISESDLTKLSNTK